ncbi:MAG: diaminopimelate epimerase [Paracoccaceae bacterium]
MLEQLSDGLPFMKMHGAGNDFVIIDSQGAAQVMTPELARAIGDRHRGVGFDQLAEIRSTDAADIQIDFWNADGSMAAACGNATRCIAHDFLSRSDRNTLSIKTERGILAAARNADGQVSVNMGLPQFGWQDIPLSHQVDTDHLPLDGRPAAVGMGNPHCVFFVDDIGEVDVAARGPELEHHALFPQATNVEFSQVRSETDIRMRVWERGTGITLACGSGACAVVVAASRRGLTKRKVSVEVDGGVLTIDWRDDGVWMSGPTAKVFSATLDAAFLAAV